MIKGHLIHLVGYFGCCFTNSRIVSLFRRKKFLHHLFLRNLGSKNE